MSKVTTIRWRPYPEQKPTRSDHLTVLTVNGEVTSMDYIKDCDGFGESPEECESHLFNEIVAAFAEPEDITTEDLP